MVVDYIAYDPTIQSIVVSQQGTDPREILSLAVDADFLQSPINATYFPTAPNNTLVHAGFQDAFLRTVEDVKTQVTNGLQAYNVSNVLVTGHSLGAAIGVMNGVFLKGLFGDQVNVTTHVFGLPRAGNSIWAYVFHFGYGYLVVIILINILITFTFEQGFRGFYIEQYASAHAPRT